MNIRLFANVTRAQTLPVMIAPVVIGAILAWQQGASFNWGLFLLTFLGAMAAHLGANVVNDVFDFAEGTDQKAQEMFAEGTTVATGSKTIMEGTFSLSDSKRLWIILFGIALLSGIILSFFRPWVLAFGIAGFLLAYFYVAPPLRLAYRGRGLGEVDILLSFGILPLVGAYYVQAGQVTISALLAALPIGLYTLIVLYFHHFLHWRADKEVGKVTPVVALGERTARRVGALLLFVTALLFVVMALLRVFPWYAALAALTIIPVLGALQRAKGDLKQYGALMMANMNSNLLAALLITVSLLISGFVHV